jgi:hypothetical protein
MMCDDINLTGLAAQGISKALKQDINKVELPDRMAWIVWQLRKVHDTEEYFPCGKWATIQAIESQLDRCADYALERKEVK